MGQSVVHDFESKLAASHRAEDLPFWGATYRKAFPDMVEMINHRQDGDHQRAGIDRSIVMANSKQVLIDEKVRGRNSNGTVYSDIALEFISDVARRTPGWVVKPLLADYIAYAIAPLGKCYLLPVLQLQEVWRMKGEAWKLQYGVREAHNRNNGNRWTTLFTPVPVNPLFGSIGQCLRLEFTRIEIKEGDYEQ